MRIAVTIFLVLFAAAASAQQPIVSDDLKAIQDNSFLIEEAYNQTPGVVQHITVFERDRRTRGWGLGFTQEWPLLSPKHQLSYTIPFDGGGGDGFGNVAVHYRYQLVGDGDADLAIAPRFSLLLPTSSGERDHGFEVALPISRILAPRIAAHTNVVASWTEDQDFGVHLAQSAVYAHSSRIHFLLEATYDRASGGDDDELFLSPGVRWAYNFKNGLQIAPGVAFPIGLGNSSGEQHVLLYLSFEHPFSR